MPKRKSAEADAKTMAAEPNKSSRPATPRAAVATHKRAVKNTTETAVAQSVAAPTRELIALLAYSYWEQRGYQGGSEVEDWLRAEAELLKLA